LDGISQEPDEHLNEKQERIRASLESAWRSASHCFSHDQAQVERPGMNEQSLDDVVMMPQVSSPHASGLIHMREASFHQFSPLPQQPLSALSPDASPVLINR
jgi:hypothetical protein